MKTIILACLAFSSLTGCERQEPPMEMVIPPPPVVAQTPAVIPPYSTQRQEETIIFQPGSITNEEISETNFPEVIEPQTENGAPIQKIHSPAVIPPPQPHYQQNNVNENNAVNNSDPAVFVSPYAQ